jgi:microcompartment protein CcmL/EutN
VLTKMAIGLIETIAMVAAVEAADAALKSANVTLLGIENAQGKGMMTVIVTGDVGAVKAAVEAAAVKAAAIGSVVSTKVIARPNESVLKMFEKPQTQATEPKITEEPQTQLPPEPEVVVEEEIKEEIKAEEPKEEVLPEPEVAEVEEQKAPTSKPKSNKSKK